MSLNFVSLTCPFVDGENNPVTTGTVTFTPSTVVTDSADNVILTQAPVIRNLAKDPSPTVRLIACDNPGLQPSGWGWVIQPNFPGAPPGTAYQLNFASGASQNLADLLPVSTVPQVITPIVVTGTPATGQIIRATSATAADWEDVPAATPGGAAAGDLGGSYPAPSVQAIQGTAIAAPPGGTAAFLAADGTWQIPPGTGGGGGGGGITSVAAANASVVVANGSTAPSVSTGTLDVIASTAATKPVAAVPMNGQKLTGLAAGTAAGDSARFGQLPSASNLLGIASGGTSATTAPDALTALGALAKAGGTLTGPLVLAADPTAALGAATKQYVDAHGGGGTAVVDWLNLGSYAGADPTGAADSFTALNAWIADINSTGKPGYIPQGVYKTNTSLPPVTANGVTIAGDGWSQSSQTAGSVIQAGNSATCQTILTLAGDATTLTGLSLDGANKASTLVRITGPHSVLANMQARGVQGQQAVTTPAVPATGVAVTNSTGKDVYAAIPDGTITSSGATGGIQVNGTQVTTFTPAYVFVPAGATITLNYSAPPTTWSWNTPGVCVDVQNGGISTWIDKSVINGLNMPNYGIQLNDTDAIITACKPQNSTWNVVLLNVAPGTLIASNHMTPGANGQGCIWSRGNASHWVCTGNRFDNWVRSAIFLQPPASTPSNIQITNNEFHGILTDESNPYALIGVDTSKSGIRGLHVVSNTGYALGGGTPHRPAYALAAQTQGGLTTGQVASRLGSLGLVFSNNNFFVRTAMLGPGVVPTVATGNMVTLDGTTYAPVPELPAAGLPVTLTYSSTLTPDASLGSDFRVTLTGGPNTLASPVNPTDGQRITVTFTQDATGSRAVTTYGTAYSFSTSLPQPVLSTAPGASDEIGFKYYAAAGKWRCEAYVLGYS